MVETKGDFANLQATHFIVTTTCRPEVLWHRKTGEAINQLIRRITLIVEYFPDGSTNYLKDEFTTYTMLHRDEIELMYPKEYSNNQGFTF